MGDFYKESFGVAYFGTDDKLLLKPSSLAVYFQDLAIRHSDFLGYTIARLTEWRRGWAITNWHIIVYRYPLCGETIDITTWSNKCGRMQAERSFRVTDEQGEVICIAMSRWIYMDLEKRKPASLEEGMEEAYTCPAPPAIEKERYIMPKGVSENLQAERIFTVTRRDTDTNGHTNNTKYIEWALDDVPDNIYLTHSTKDIRVVYRRECYKGDRVLSRCYVKQLQEGYEVISFFLCAEDPAVVYAEVSTLWEKAELVPSES